MRQAWRAAAALTALLAALAGWWAAGPATAPDAGATLTSSRGAAAVEPRAARPPAKLAVALRVPQPPPTTTTTTAPPAPPAPEPTPLLAADAVGSSVALYDAPGAATPSGSLANPQPYSVDLSFRVLERMGDWLHVAVPTRPNGAHAWIRAADVVTRQVPNRIVVERGARRVTVYRGMSGEVLFQAPVAIGKSSTPTPLGDLYYVDAVRATGNPGGVYGPYQMRISAFSEVLYSFNGGPGQVAFHGTNSPSLVGSAVSNGCLRMYNGDITTLVGLAPVGTPVQILP